MEVTFRSFLRTMVNIDVFKPLNPGFFLSREDGSSSWVSLKYERLDIYCINCGLIGHYKALCLTPKEDQNLSRYIISLKVNAFSNLIPSISSSNHPGNYASTSPYSFIRKDSFQPFMGSSLPHVNKENILTSSQNSLTS